MNRKSFDPKGQGARTKVRGLEQLVHERTDNLSKTKLSTEVKEKDKDAIRSSSRPQDSRRKGSSGAGAQFSRFDRSGTPGSANSFRTQPGPRSLAQPGRNAFGVCGEAAPGDAYDAIAIYVRHGDELVPDM